MKEKLAGAGALVGAILASSCCWLPLLLIAVGAGSGFAPASTLDKYRVPLAGFALAALGTAWYFTYRRPKPKEPASDGPVVPARNPPCPCCGKPGKKVPEKTVAALLTDAARARMARDPYYLCQAPECALVYYAAGGSPRFRKEDVRIRVGFKESAPPHLVCYCFEHSVEGIEEELRRTASTTVPERIKAEIQAGRCACEVKNPQGTCCLGNVNRAVAEARDRIAGRSSAPVGAPAVQCTIAPDPNETHDACCRLGGKNETDGSESCCTSGAPVKSVNKVMLWILTPLVLAFALFPDQIFALFLSDRKPDQDAVAPVAAGEERFVLLVEGMT